jgi:hypothetical protein
MASHFPRQRVTSLAQGDAHDSSSVGTDRSGGSGNFTSSTGQSTGPGGSLHPPSRNDGLYRTFTPTNAGWNLGDYAWDKQANRVVSRETIARQAGVHAAQSHEKRAESGYPLSSGGVNPDETNSPLKVEHAMKAARGGLPAKHAAHRESSLRSTKSEDSQIKIVSPTPNRVGTHAAHALGVMERCAPVKRETPLAVSQTKARPNSDSNSERVVEEDGALNNAVAVSFSRQCAATGCREMCQPSSKRRVERILCVAHGASRDVDVLGEPHRFCQVCYALHPASAFKVTNRTCNAVLARKRMLRIQRQRRVGGGKGGGDAEADTGASDADVDDAKGETANDKLRDVAAVCVSVTEPEKETRASRGKQAAKVGKRRQNSHNPTIGKKPVCVDVAVPVATAADGARATATAHANAGGWFWSSLRYPAAQTAPPTAPSHGNAGKRARLLTAEEDELRNQLVLDMEHGALGSARIVSAAIKIPHATPAFLSVAAGGSGRCVSLGDARLDADAGDDAARVAFAWGGDDKAAGGYQSSDATCLAFPNREHDAQNTQPDSLENEMNSLLRWMDQTPSVLTAAEGGGRMEDFGFDPFIRPGSLIYGVHAQGMVTSPFGGRGCDDDENENVSARTLGRHSSRSMIESIANGNTPSGRLLRNASAALRETGGRADGTGGDDKNNCHQEGVFGSFNGEICRLRVSPIDGTTTTTIVPGLPTGFVPNLLAASQSCLDTSKETASFVVPTTIGPDLAVVCMFQGAHLPLRFDSKKDGSTEITICFTPKGGYHVAAEWVLNAGLGGGQRRPVIGAGTRTDGTDEPEWYGDSQSPCLTKMAGARLRDLEGTATLETVIADGPMRGLPVGHPLPLFLTPDHDVRHEVVRAMWRLEREIEQRKAESNSDAEWNTDDDDSKGVLPEPLALVSMLGSVLHAVGRDHFSNPRMYRGAVAMAKYFNLTHVANRLNVDLSTNKRVSAKDVSEFFANSICKILKGGRLVLFAAVVLSTCMAVFFGTDFVSRAEKNGRLGFAASVVTVALSVALIASVVATTREQRVAKRG